MVTLIVATTADPASINPARALLALPGWAPLPPLLQGMDAYANGGARLVVHGASIVVEDDLDSRWEAAGEAVEEVIFLSRHTAVSNRPALTVHPIGVPHLRDGDPVPQGGRPGWAAPPSPRIGPWIRLLKSLAASRNLVPEFEVARKSTGTGKMLPKSLPKLSMSVPSRISYNSVHLAAWKFNMVIHVGAHQFGDRSFTLGVIVVEPKREKLLWEGLGLEGGTPVGTWGSTSEKKKVLLGIGGGHYAPRHMDIVMKDGVWVGHLLSGYSLPMEDPGQNKQREPKDIGGTWRQSIKAAYEATRSAFPGGEIIAHLDQKSFKGWQKNAITAFLEELNIKIGKPNDFF